MSQAFFDKVKDKKIRWDGWGDDKFVIPQKLISDNDMRCIDEKGYYITVKIDNTSLWVFHDTERKVIVGSSSVAKHKVIQPETNLAGTCTCGAKHTSNPNAHFDWCHVYVKKTGVTKKNKVDEDWEELDAWFART